MRIRSFQRINFQALKVLRSLQIKTKIMGHSKDPKLEISAKSLKLSARVNSIKFCKFIKLNASQRRARMARYLNHLNRENEN